MLLRRPSRGSHAGSGGLELDAADDRKQAGGRADASLQDEESRVAGYVVDPVRGERVRVAAAEAGFS
jgi:hypothetical protein